MFPAAHHSKPTTLADRIAVALILVLSPLVLPGCGSEEELGPEKLYNLQRDDGVEIDLGEYTITVLIADDPTRLPDLTRYQESVALRFQLHCLVPAKHEARVRKILEEKRGRISDEVIRTCRSANLIDLADPQLKLIRAQLRDFTEELIGRGLIKRFVFTDIVLERY
ncbi:MAG: hypothetical protein WDZ51_10170 [Pirellulaceae bacterium]